MTRIHHNTLNKATAHGITLVQSEDGTTTAFEGDITLATAADPKDALDLAILALQGDQPKATRKARAPKSRVERDDNEQKNNEQEDDEALDEGDEPERSVVKAKYRAKYRPNKGHCGDDLATKLRDAFMTKKDPDTGRPRLDFDAFVKFAKANDVWVEGYRRLKDAHGNRNDGLIRMNCANRLRAKIRRDKHKIVWGV